MECVPETKKCMRCEEFFPKSEKYFLASKVNKSGFYSYCRECTKKRNKEYREKNKEKVNEYSRNYAKENPQKFIEAKKRNYQKYKEIYNERNKLYRLENPEKEKEYAAKSRKLNKEKIKQWNHEWRKRNPLSIRMKEQRRRARMRQLRSDFTATDWEKCLRFFDNKCAYCFSKESLAQDHFVPVYAGGHYSKENIIPACQRCNSSKCHREFNEWYSGQEYYSAERVLVIYEYLEKVAKTHETRRILPRRSESGEGKAR